MAIIWEGPMEKLFHRSSSELVVPFNPERELWFHDWTETRNYREFFNIRKRYEEAKPEGPWSFKPTLYATVTDDMSVPSQSWFADNPNVRIEHCSGLSRSGVNGWVAAWYALDQYQAYEAIRASVLHGLLTTIAVAQDRERPVADDLLTMLEEDEAKLRVFAPPQLQDYLLPLYVWARRKPPFDYHRKGCMMVFHIEAMPSEGALANHRIQKRCPVFMAGIKGMGIWFDNLSLATAFRLKYTSDLKEEGYTGMRIFYNGG